MSLNLPEVVLSEFNIPTIAQRRGPSVRMTFERFRTIVDAIDLRMFPAKLKVTTTQSPDRVYVDGEPANHGTVRLFVSMGCMSIYDGRPERIVRERVYPIEEILRLWSDDDAVDLIYQEVQAQVVHELQESFIVAGQRVRDPHYHEKHHRPQPPFELPDPLPPKPPEFPPYSRTLDVVTLNSPPGQSFADFKREVEKDPIKAGGRRWTFLRTGELVK